MSRALGGTSLTIAIADLDGAGADRLEPGDHAQRRALAAARRADEHDEFAVLHLEIDAIAPLPVPPFVINFPNALERYASP